MVQWSRSTALCGPENSRECGWRYDTTKALSCKEGQVSHPRYSRWGRDSAKNV
ncbi:hypothetical protein BACCAP_00249 [Pseudoflavonifractor capillosus ATCC 29799]|uniref:Uncharacterized protein n=1 Tax=Pseudoflavonifractor capillosus ATCC 29799 TaxID=411467 RepID=A6NPY0_9FIRM|nr:hypothetical protein BACCAP_00249 [Pseudoflavonifractor capillosus ATCC 29799]